MQPADHTLDHCPAETARLTAPGKRGTGARSASSAWTRTRWKPGLAPEGSQSTSRRRPSPTD